MQKALLILLLFSTGTGWSQNLKSGGVLKPEQANMDIRHYTVSLEVDPAAQTIQGYTEIRLNLLQPSDGMLLDLWHGLTVSKIGPWPRALSVLYRLGESVETRPLRSYSYGRSIATLLRSLARPTDGADGILRLLAERVVADGGEVRWRDRIDRIDHDGQRATAIHLAGDGAKVHTDWLVSATSTATLLEWLLRGGTLRAPVLPSRAQISRRFILSVVVRSEGVAPLLATRSVLLGPTPALDAFLERTRLQDNCERLTLSLDLEEAAVPRARETLLSLLETYLPFVEQHYLVVDSPHDGRPLWVFKRGQRTEVERAHIKAGGASLEREPMESRSSLDAEPFEGEPFRPFGKNVLLVGESTVPGVGTEGALLSAIAVASWLTEKDPQKGRLRRRSWTKIEMG